MIKKWNKIKKISSLGHHPALMHTMLGGSRIMHTMLGGSGGMRTMLGGTGGMHTMLGGSRGMHTMLGGSGGMPVRKIRDDRCTLTVGAEVLL